MWSCLNDHGWKEDFGGSISSMMNRVGRLLERHGVLRIRRTRQNKPDPTALCKPMCAVSQLQSYALIVASWWEPGVRVGNTV